MADFTKIKREQLQSQIEDALYELFNATISFEDRKELVKKIDRIAELVKKMNYIK